jgi:hypothetical protein
MVATAPESEGGKFAIELFVHVLPRIDKKSGGLLILEIATTVGVGRIDL